MATVCWILSASWRKMMPRSENGFFEEVFSLIHASADAGSEREGGKPFLLVTHERPDGDAVGSLSALWILLNGNGYRADALFPEEAPDFYRSFLCPVLKEPLSAEEINERYSLLINADASTVARLGLGGVDFTDLKLPLLTLDHHPDNGRFAQVNHVDPSACSTAEVVYFLARAADWRISPAAATALLLGITTDSGCFRFDNTTAESMRAAASLLDLGADHHAIIEKVYLSKPVNMAVFEAEMLSRHLRSALDGKLVWLLLDPALMKRYSIDMRNTEQLIELLRGMEGVEVAALLKPCGGKDGKMEMYKISLRSKNPEISVGRIARRLGGGGHEMAAGCSISAENAEEAESILIQNVEMEFQETQS